MGAKVIKVEQEGSTGDIMSRSKVAFAWISNNKERVSMDLRSEDGKRQLEMLLKDADVLVENFKAGVIEQMGFGWERVHRMFPKLIMCSISGFGQTGPWKNRPAMDVVIQAMSGIMSTTGFSDKPPVGVGAPIADVTAGLYGSIGILSAIIGRGTTDLGSYVDVGMLDVMAAVVAPLLIRSLNSTPGFDNGKQPARSGSSSRSAAPFDTYRTKDGLIALIGMQSHFYERICDVIERPGMKAENDARFKTTVHRRRNYGLFKGMLEEALSHRTTDEWMEKFSNEGVPCGRVNNLQEALAEPQLQYRKMTMSLHNTDETGKKNPIHLIASPLNISGWSKRKPWVKREDENGTFYRSKM
eukprot:g2969.t1